MGDVGEVPAPEVDFGQIFGSMLEDGAELHGDFSFLDTDTGGDEGLGLLGGMDPENVPSGETDFAAMFRERSPSPWMGLVFLPS